MMTGSPLSPTLAMCEEPKRATSKQEVSSPVAITKQLSQPSRIPQLKQAKSVGKNLLISPDIQKSAMKNQEVKSHRAGMQHKTL